MTTSGIPAEAVDLLRRTLGEGWRADRLSGDASVRAYYRVATDDGRSFILAWYPEEVRPQLGRFMSAYRALAPHAAVPLVVGTSESAVLQVDVGERTAFDELQEHPESGAGLYRRAVDLLAGFQKARSDLNPPFSAEFFANELAMAREYYIGRLTGGTAGSELDGYLQRLANKIAQHPYVLCHRDYHGQNIHIINDTLFVIDYQDLRNGPDTYDLASLLRDRGVADVLGEPLELELLEHYAADRGDDPARMRTRYFETLLQRSIKILGTFARLPIERGRMHYLDFIPATLRSVARCSAELPEFAPLAEFFPAGFSLDRARRRATELHEGLS
ncbi:MAG: phosphotransferase [Thermoanaerobaculia bacterium]